VELQEERENMKEGNTMKTIVIIAFITLFIISAAWAEEPVKSFEELKSYKFPAEILINPAKLIIFGTPEVGRLEWGSGKLIFTGNIDESARIFFEYFWKEYGLKSCP